ncbi:MAG: hypothetical protein ABIP17_03530 [Ilumatobacteraceae bacterium]
MTAPMPIARHHHRCSIDAFASIVDDEHVLVKHPGLGTSPR